MSKPSGPPGLLAFAEQVYPALDRYSYYQLLRVDPKADVRTIRASYYKIATQLHPDRYQRLVDAGTRDRLETIYARITEAYRILTNGEKRAAYDAGLPTGKLRDTGERALKKSPEDALSHAEAKKFFRLGMVCFGSRDWKGAVMNFNFARSFEPDAAIIAEKLAEAQAAAKGGGSSGGSPRG
jgi:DnaJ-class molecular chaperone